MRNILIIIGIVFVIAIFSVAIFFYGGNTPTSSLAESGGGPAAVAVPFTELAQGAQSTVAVPTNYLITSESQLNKLWEMIDTNGQTAPVVNFATNEVIAVFAGREPTNGYAVTVSKVEDTHARVVIVTLVKPSSGCTLAKSVTAPYQIVELPKTTLPFTHKNQTTVTSCSQ